MIGETVGSYRIVSKVSIGGMGTVYRAEHTLIGKIAAVKVLHPELSANQEIVKRFFIEAKATIAIKHPGIVQVFDFGYMPSGDAFLIMEFLEGMSLARRLKGGARMGEGEAAMLLRGVCSALQAAHLQGIIHRDLKPDNIFLVPDPEAATGVRPKVLDFGIAKLTDVGLADATTRTGAVMGTPTYMSPEQCRGTGNVDHRADLYSLGCIFYELMCGRPPFTSLGAGEILGAHLYLEPEPPTKYNREISRETAKLIMALLDKDPDRRPQSARELGQRLQMLAESLGWITAASPNGVTSEALRELPTVLGRRPSGEIELAGVRTTEPPAAPTQPPNATTPYGLEVSALVAASREADDVSDKPTTLSGAASQSVHDIPPTRRKRRGLGVAVLAVGLAAGVAAVAVVKATRKDVTAEAATAPKNEALVTSAIESADKAVADRASQRAGEPADGTDKTVGDKAAADVNATADKVPVDKAAADKTGANKLAADKAPAEKAITEKTTVDKTAADKAAADKAAADKIAADKTAADKLAADKASVDKAAADKAAADKAAADKLAQQKAAADAAHRQKVAADKLAADKRLAAQKAAADKAAADKAAADKAAADKAKTNTLFEKNL